MKKNFARDLAIIVGSMAVFFIVVMIFPGIGEEPPYATVASAVFAIYLGFAISGSRSRSEQVSELLKEHNGYVLIIYRLSEVFDAKIRKQIQNLIDNYLIEQIDYALDDFNLSEKSFKKLYEYLIHLPTKTKKQEGAYDNMIDVADDISVTRTKVEALVRTKLSKVEWVATLTFLVITVTVFYFMSDGSLINSIIYTVAVGAMVLLVIILKRSNSLKWDKNKWTWEPLRDLFINLDLIPYYPLDAVDRGEIILPKGEEVRAAKYFSPYPNVQNKEVKILKL